MTTLANALCSLDEVKNYMNIKGSDSIMDDVLENLCVRVTEAFEKYCGVKQFKSQTYTEYYDGNGCRELFINNLPLTSITSIAEDSDWDFTSDSTIGSDEYAIVDECRIAMKTDYFTHGIRNFKIIYTAGYSTIPNDLKQAAIMEVVRLYKLKDNIDVSQKSGPDGSVTKLQQGFLPDTTNILKRYLGIGVY